MLKPALKLKYPSREINNLYGVFRKKSFKRVTKIINFKLPLKIENKTLNSLLYIVFLTYLDAFYPIYWILCTPKVW